MILKDILFRKGERRQKECVNNAKEKTYADFSSGKCYFLLNENHNSDSGREQGIPIILLVNKDIRRWTKKQAENSAVRTVCNF